MEVLTENYIIMETTGALKNVSFAIDQWNPILLYLLQKRKLDSYLRSQSELSVDTTKNPTLLKLTNCLTKYFKTATVS